MSKKEDTLGPEHVARFPEWRDKWIANGLDTKPMDEADKQAVRDSIRAMYEWIKKPQPRFVIFMPSLEASKMAVQLLNSPLFLRDQVRAQVRAQVWAQVGDQVWAQVGAQVGAQVRAQVWAQVGAQVRAQVGAQVRAQVGAQVRAQVGDQVRAQVGDQVWAQVWAQVGSDGMWRRWWPAQLESPYFSWVSFFDQVAPKTTVDFTMFNRILGAVTGCFSMFMDELCVVVCDRPVHITFDDARRAHNETGPYIKFSDGTGIYAWHGQRIPGWIVDHPDQITPEKIDAEGNAETRRIMIEIFGASKYFEATEAKILDVDTLKLKGSAPRCLMRDKHGNKWLFVSDGSTGRQYTLAAPNDAKTCSEAMAALNGVDDSRCVEES